MALNDKIIKGSDLMIFVEGNPIAFATSCEISMSAETSETSNKDSGNGWTSAAVTKRSWTASSDNMYAESAYTGEHTFASLFQLYANGTPVQLVWSPNQNAAKTTGRIAEVEDAAGWSKTGTPYSGRAIITSLSATASNDDNATFSVEFTGVSPIVLGTVSSSSSSSDSSTGS